MVPNLVKNLLLNNLDIIDHIPVRYESGDFDFFYCRSRIIPVPLEALIKFKKIVTYGPRFVPQYRYFLLPQYDVRYGIQYLCEVGSGMMLGWGQSNVIHPVLVF